MRSLDVGPSSDLAVANDTAPRLRRSRLLLGAVVLIVVVAAVGGGLWLRRLHSAHALHDHSDGFAVLQVGYRQGWRQGSQHTGRDLHLRVKAARN